MRSAGLFLLATLAIPALSAPLEAKRKIKIPDEATITQLAPNLGFTAGLNPNGTGFCDGAVNGTDGQPVKIPCYCPPPPEIYIPALIQNVQAGFAVNDSVANITFPTGNTKQDKFARIAAAIITIAHFNGTGQGCTTDSTDLVALLQAIGNEPDQPTPSSSADGPPANSTTPTNDIPDEATITRLAPDLGFTAGLNPNGTGFCDGAVNGTDGEPVKVPCFCPPPPDIYIPALIKNVQAGFAINDTNANVTFPTGNTKHDKFARIAAAITTIATFNGSGQGCPSESTTLEALHRAISNETEPTPTPSPTDNPPVSSSILPPASSTTPASDPTPVNSRRSANNSTPANNTQPNGTPDAATITRLAPELGFESGVNPTGTGDCDGAVNGTDGKPIKIPCSCPPPQDEYISQLIANVQAGMAIHNPSVAVSFPIGDSKADKSARLTAASITLQNLNGPGKGCPVASTTFSQQQKAIDAGTDAVPNQYGLSVDGEPTPVPSNTPANDTGSLDAATIKRAAPELGFQSGINPTGTGDCDGAVNGTDGKPVKIPCSCPPSQDVYLDALVKNVQAGFAVNNPSVKISFPTDDSNKSQSTRITAALITLQNLNGPGKGCPAASTTLLARQKALAA